MYRAGFARPQAPPHDVEKEWPPVPSSSRSARTCPTAEAETHASILNSLPSTEVKTCIALERSTVNARFFKRLQAAAKLLVDAAGESWSAILPQLYIGPKTLRITFNSSFVGPCFGVGCLGGGCMGLYKKKAEVHGPRPAKSLKAPKSLDPSALHSELQAGADPQCWIPCGTSKNMLQEY